MELKNFLNLQDFKIIAIKHINRLYMFVKAILMGKKKKVAQSATVKSMTS